jgi:signal transduction histidine kinase
MPAANAGASRAGHGPALELRRLAVALGLALAAAGLLATHWTIAAWTLVLRTVTLALVGVLVFGLLERWPPRLPGWFPRWVLQVVGVGAAMPLTTFAVYVLSTRPGAPPFWLEEARMVGFAGLTFLALLLAPWTALAALLHQRDAFARGQALAFELERTELERQALEARLHLLQAQVAPHFLFNTLANVQALVDAGSPQASTVLRRLVTYLRAAVPTLAEPEATLAREIELVEAYLEVMRLRMPDRLEIAVRVDAAALGLACPSTALLTLVENAVKHGIDPSEQGGRIDVEVVVRGDRCVLRVRDTGVGLQPSSRGPGTGLATLRDRLQLLYGDAAQLRIGENFPRGVCAEVELPAQGGGT